MKHMGKGVRQEGSWHAAHARLQGRGRRQDFCRRETCRAVMTRPEYLAPLQVAAGNTRALDVCSYRGVFVRRQSETLSCKSVRIPLPLTGNDGITLCHTSSSRALSVAFQSFGFVQATVDGSSSKFRSRHTQRGNARNRNRKQRGKSWHVDRSFNILAVLDRCTH